MSDFKRTDRIEQLLQRELALLIQKEVKDPQGSSLITLSAAHVSKDLRHAKVYFTVLNGDPHAAEGLLNAAAPYLRTVLAKTWTQRTVPQLRFVHDASIEYAAELSRLIDKVSPADDEDSH